MSKRSSKNAGFLSKMNVNGHTINKNGTQSPFRKKKKKKVKELKRSNRSYHKHEVDATNGRVKLV